MAVDCAPTPQVPEELLPPKSGSPAARLRAWRHRHLLRERRAEEFFADSRKPDLGLPVADRRDVGAFASRLLKSRRLMITALLVLHALAAMAGLVVPRILGSLVDAASAGGTLAATLNGLALAVTGVVVLQAILTFFALRMSVLFGQDLLAEAREYVVRTVLGLPLGRVESASTGDLVTRVTRDVSTMSMSVRFGLPESVIASMTTLLTVVAMLLNSPLLTLPLLVTAPLLIFAATLRETGTEGLHHRGRHVLPDQLDIHRDGRRCADCRVPLGCSGIGSSRAIRTSRYRHRPSDTR